VLWELAHRQNPYGTKDPMSVALDVARNGIRPTITAKMPREYEGTVPFYFACIPLYCNTSIDLMVLCWDQDPEKRPSFQEITKRLRQMTMKHPVVNLGTHDMKAEAPSGLVYFVQTEIGARISYDFSLPLLYSIDISFQFGPVVERVTKLFNAFLTDVFVVISAVIMEQINSKV
jgi:hypothetical protein